MPSAPGLRTTTRLVEGAFPCRQALVPGDFAIVVLADRDALAVAVGRVAVVTQTDAPIRLHVDSGAQQIRVEAGHGDNARAVDEVVAETEGDVEDIAFNQAFLLAALRPVADPLVRIGIQPSTRPAPITTIRPRNSAPPDARSAVVARCRSGRTTGAGTRAAHDLAGRQDRRRLAVRVRRGLRARHLPRQLLQRPRPAGLRQWIGRRAHDRPPEPHCRGLRPS